MADKTKIEWTDATWNPITGCSIVSPGCTNCYAMRLAGTRLKHHPTREGLTTETKAGPVWNGEVKFNRRALLQPLEWKRGRMIFVCAHGDLFAENVPEDWIDQVFAIMALAQHHTFQVLTKRSERMQTYLASSELQDRIADAAFSIDPEAGSILSADIQIAGDKLFPLPNIWLGVSVEDQKRASERIMPLLTTPAAKRFVSAEPLLGPVNLVDIDWGDGSLDALKVKTWKREIDCWRDTEPTWEHSFLDWYNLADMPDDEDIMHPVLDWVVVGGESGPDARPMHPDWARSLRDQCAAAGVPFFFKQWGEWLPMKQSEGKLLPATTISYDVLNDPRGSFHSRAYKIGKTRAGRLLDGVEHNAMPSIDRRAA